MELSSLLNRFSEPETLKMAKLGRELRAQGIDVIDLSLGEPDFDTPQHIKDAAIKAINDNWSHYTPVPGFLDLREAVCTKLKRDNNLDYKPEHIVVSTGAKQSLANSILALVDEGDEVIIPTPYWVTYSELVKIARGKVVEIRTTVENKFKTTAAELEAAITPKTKVFMFSSPCNPSGAVYSKEELAALVKVFEKHPGITILSDEIYEYINFMGKHESIAQFDSIKDQVVIINGLSKGFAMTGWRLGYIAANSAISKACEKLQGQFTSGTCSIAQKAAVAALTGDLRPSLEMTEEFTRRRTKTLELVNAIPGFKCFAPEGAFYVFPDVSYYYGKSNGTETIKNAADFSMYLLNTAHVSSVMGDAFGEPNCVRFSFANSMQNIERAWERISEALSKLS
ncbi:MAG TPA: pyridoxal phosphate-dependent aminotransferase [Sediminibacterium sp.]|jgi:aspartate aminotransferase|uniref:pyridoxal phosphate-dependent aminotransferase n=1 Tax=Sediminibacterium sp. TaxID=1917865 RepID=UPI0008B990A2|nr:pyridoxal phosphate-dependent aminotransferase [Sediminibacterium sp.]OHC84338.1 MAG: aspartate aminotransferase [Sphingobacteriia bacterium RIFOXYC2_FULL_35_18]OHC88714.1 MAG: aspartate aminotransferase [Sphingobacteriia bacterium RIFOXYD2_FULL_35_12]OYY11820.1 MAG: aspartate aminotransferase [Sphingobacteriia bacterium 35-36-14]OYZ54723.1 MAG: aspartate aminotransferase [Sphingobacteriia bacterium 24-36-13]OZA65558.1 MAG: aspartate aminotransferase [Sphingobacteriia bacterium 39-36-14]